MCPRRYRLGRREAEVLATRDAILHAAGHLFQEFGYHRTSIEDIARYADVAPATVYYQFGSKPALLEAVLASILHGGGDGAPTLDPDRCATAEQFLAECVRRVCRLWMRQPNLLRSLLGLGAVDPSLRPMIESHDDARHALLMQVTERLTELDALAPGYDARRAADVLSLLTSFASFDHLIDARGLDVDAALELLIDLSMVVVDPERRSDALLPVAVTSTR